MVDLQITLDNSGTFYRSELFLRSTSLDEVMGDSEEVMGESEELRAVRTEYENEEADHVDFSRKHSTTYYFSDLPSNLRDEVKAKVQGQRLCKLNFSDSSDLACWIKLYQPCSRFSGRS